jgi:hypothetical protein
MRKLVKILLIIGCITTSAILMVMDEGDYSGLLIFLNFVIAYFTYRSL